MKECSERDYAFQFVLQGGGTDRARMGGEAPLSELSAEGRLAGSR